VISRRAFFALALACSKRVPPPVRAAPLIANANPSEPPSVRVLEWTMDPWPGGPATAKILVPGWAREGEKFPLVVALHGRGEALKGPDRGASGWPDDYGMVRAFDRLRHPPITSEDLEGMVDEARLAAINARAFRGVVVACPYLPDLDLLSDSELKNYGRAIVDSLVSRVRKEAPVIARADATGIDGVSLGGVTALRVGLGNAETFGAVGALQPAIAEWQAGELTEIARAARAKNPSLKLRLITSDLDGFRRATEALSRAWKAAAIDHEMAVLPGPHDYPFNRGPGVYELLTFHDRVLAR